ncbi:polyphenol oxidase family protein [Desulfurobacterium sp.]
MKYEIFISEKPTDGREIEEIKGIPVIRPVQLHSSTVVFAGRRYSGRKGDAIVTDNRKVWVGVLSADCIPILVVARGMVAAIHAGWRGTLKGITFKTLKYIQTFTDVQKIIIGPGICNKCYEVGEDVYKLFNPHLRNRLFRPYGSKKYLFDLKKANTIQAKSAGVSVIEDLNLCTVCNNDRFYSFRKEKTEKRILSAIRLL